MHPQADLLRQLYVRGLLQGRSIREEHQRQSGAIGTGELQQVAAFLIDLDVQPLVRNEVPGQKILGLV